MASIKEVMSVISSQIIVPIIVSVVTTIATSKIKDKRKRRQKAKDKLKEVLTKIEKKEEITNSSVIINNKVNDYCHTYHSYLGNLEELKKLINIYEKDIPKESISSFKELCQEINQKLIIYGQAFITNDDIQKREREIYYYCYIEPNQTKIQQKLEELLKL